MNERKKNNENENIYKKYKSVEHIKFKIENIKNVIGLSKNDNYILSLIKKYWILEFDSSIIENTEIHEYKDNILYIDVSDHLINNFLNVNKEKIMKKINNHLEKLEIKKIDNIILKYGKKIRTNITDSLVELKNNKKEIEFDNNDNYKNEDKDDVNIEEIEISEKDIEKLKKNFEKIEENNIFKEKMQKIGINILKKKKYLLSIGYKECINCNSLFLENEIKNNKCYICYLEEKQKQENTAKKLLKENPFIGELDLHIKTKIDKRTYYKLRDILSEEVYRNIIYFIKEIKADIDFLENNEKIYFSNKNKYKYNELLNEYVNYKIGTKIDVIRKKEIEKLKKRIFIELKFLK